MRQGLSVRYTDESVARYRVRKCDGITLQGHWII
jgi:hypothetical protein